MKNLKSVFSRLGINESNGLYITKEYVWKKELSLPSRVQRLLENELQPDAFFVFDQKPLVLFFDSPAEPKNIHRAIWNFNESPVAVIANDYDIEIFNGFNLNKRTELLESFGKSESLDDFSYFQLVTGKTWEQHEKQLSYENRVDHLLLKNIKAAREVIAPGLNNTKSTLANALLGKAIFVRYLIDRHVTLNFDDVSKTWSNEEFCELLSSPKDVRRFFEYLESKDKGFNGDLFRINATDYDRLTAHDFDVIKRLLSGEDIIKGQRSLFDFYDFSIIPIEFISNVYELFIGRDNQKKEGAYYTPLFLVDYILKETVERHLDNRENGDAPEDFTYCKVLDPACGSGIFLVETLRKIIERYKKETQIDVKSDAFKNAIRELAKANIFGIDKDESAVQVAVFSIYLTLLDYLEPKEISNFKFPILLNTNFFHGDFFDLKAGYNDSLADVTFDFIVGNPPWKRGADEKQPLYVKYINQRREEELKNNGPEIAIGNKEIAQAFVLRSSDFSNSSTECGLIVTSKALYNVQSVNFRRYFLSNYKLKRVLELAPVRREVFDRSNDKAIAPACILFYSFVRDAPLKDNIFEHIALKPSRFFSLFKIFTITRTDFKKVQQAKLIEYDWLWKVLVYGSYLDFNLIKRLKEEFTSIKSTLNSLNIISGTGIQDSNTATYDTNNLKGLRFIDPHAIKDFFVSPNKIGIFDQDKVHRVRDERLFHGPMLLTRKGLDMEKLTIKCAIYEGNALFKDSITSIVLTEHQHQKILYNLAAIFSSNLFSYFAINTFASVGIEREQTQNEDKYSLPYLQDLVAKPYVEKINNLSERIFEEEQKVLINQVAVSNLKNQIIKVYSSINKSINEVLRLNEVELSLINYALTINRCLITNKSANRFNQDIYLGNEDNCLKDYAQVFINRFKSSLRTEDTKFVVEIWHTKQLIGMLFKVIPAIEPQNEIEWFNQQDDASGIFAFLTKISSSKITDRLFVQKDIRGFEQDYFYIFKPNEKRLWHKAIAHLDVDEFADAMLKAGGAGL